MLEFLVAFLMICSGSYGRRTTPVVTVIFPHVIVRYTIVCYQIFYITVAEHCSPIFLSDVCE